MTQRDLARITSADIGEVYNGMVGLVVCFEYDGCGAQCLSGYMIEAAMVARFMAAVDVLRLQDAVGKSCWVTHTHAKIHKIEPLHKKDGRPFDIGEWQEWVQKRFPDAPSYNEMLTGERSPKEA